MRGIRARHEEMCHVKPNIEIGDCNLFGLVLVLPSLGMCANDSSGVYRRIFRLLFEHFCEKFNVLSVERPVGRCCGFIAGDV